jgi:hypothetical protein
VTDEVDDAAKADDHALEVTPVGDKVKFDERRPFRIARR